jgi:tetratricopeptide (TPR) repeat protein
MDIEEELLKVDKAIREEEYSSAMNALYLILEERPELGRAHNDLGWLFQRKISDLEQAEKHYKYAIKFSPKHPMAYLNYIYLLRDAGRVDDLEKILLQAETVEHISRSSLFDEYGSLYEIKEEYEKAIEYYEKAIKFTFNSESIDELKKHIRRCKDKKDFFRGNRIYKAFKVLINRE